MPQKLPIPAREAQARREIGDTRISRTGAWTLVASLVALFALGAALQLVFKPDPFRDLSALPAAARDAWNRDAPGNRLFRANRALLEAMESWEDDLDDQAWFRPRLLRHAQPALWALGSGNGNAVRGRDGWMLFQPDIEYVTAPPFDVEAPRDAILDFAAQLARRDIRLVVAPAPVKPQIHPESLTARTVDVPVRNPSETELFAELAAGGVEVVDLAARAERFRYLKTDTHWTPDTMREAAALTARTVRDLGLAPLAAPVPHEIRRSEITQSGDIADMLAPPGEESFIAPETIEHEEVVWRGEASRRVLVLGDSFSNIYSLEAMGWGAGGGFAEHLGAALGEPVRALRRNDAGASATRRLLARELARGRDPLEGIEVVVWQFAAREFLLGDWSPVAMEFREPAPRSGDSTLLEGVNAFRGTARVESVSPIPRPGQVPYADHVASLHLVDLQSDDGRVKNGEALVRALSMKDHRLTDIARLRRGDRISVRLAPFADVEDRYGSLNQSVLDTPELFLVEPFWMESFTHEP